MNVLDLFSGIGGFSLGLERAGMRTVAFCEIEAFPRCVLAKHWPEVPCYDDVRTLTAGRLAADGISVDLICGGFPCQDISTAGKGAGIDGERSGLWSEYARLIGEIRPSYVIVENVAALLIRGIDRVLGDLAALGYDAEWHCISAAAIGAPHRRDRIWIVANARSGRCGEPGVRQDQFEGRAEIVGASENLANAAVKGLSGGGVRGRQAPGLSHTSNNGENVSDTGCQPAQVPITGQLAAIEIPQRNTWWAVEPDVGRVAHGVPARMDRLKALGNAVVPQIPEIIGRAIMQQFSIPAA